MKLKRPTKKANCPNRKKFDAVCDEIRKALHIEHWRKDYTFTNEDEGATASCRTPDSLGNRRIWINIHKPFWEYDYDEQLKTLIHEHIHVVLSPYDQALKGIIGELHDSDKPWAKHILFSGAAESVTDHLESVIYDLIKDRF